MRFTAQRPSSLHAGCRRSVKGLRPIAEKIPATAESLPVGVGVGKGRVPVPGVADHPSQTSLLVYQDFARLSEPYLNTTSIISGTRSLGIPQGE